ncbi:MAG: class IV adenylate cyclase [bacterium]|nr:class IV adenylate cyclase [bacterium]
MSTNNIEIEVKINIDNVTIDSLKKKITAHNFTTVLPRTFEHNIVFDTPKGKLKKKKLLLRLRRFNDTTILTFKRPSKIPGTENYKTKEEIEVDIPEFEKMNTIITGLGYEPVFIYEKYREIFKQGHVEIMIDETPIGNYIEIEGAPEDIDRTAHLLGYSKNDYITANYRKLFKRAKGTGHMVFPIKEECLK